MAKKSRKDLDMLYKYNTQAKLESLRILGKNKNGYISTQKVSDMSVAVVPFKAVGEVWFETEKEARKHILKTIKNIHKYYTETLERLEALQ